MKVSIQTILDIVCDYYEITPGELFAEVTTQSIVRPRHVFYYLCTEHCIGSLATIGAFASNYGCKAKGHATVLYGRDRISNEIILTPGFNGFPDTIQQIKELRRIVKHGKNTLIVNDYYHYINNMEITFEKVLPC